IAAYILPTPELKTYITRLIKPFLTAPLIHRSYRRDLQTVKLTTGLAHHDCHEIFDDHPDQAVYLPRIVEVLYIIWLLDRNYFNQISEEYEIYNEIFPLFLKVPRQNLDHHGELIQLNFLYLP
ncbi:MAG: hypothetical protein JW870_15990, partial [Candidatus Delongbacteria bacterium]|nr:hypothetical protein [Candidatus Delongbacteria bacterium]